MSPERIAAATHAVHLCWRMGWGEKKMEGRWKREKKMEGRGRGREKGDKREILYI